MERSDAEKKSATSRYKADAAAGVARASLLTHEVFGRYPQLVVKFFCPALKSAGNILGWQLLQFAFYGLIPSLVPAERFSWYSAARAVVLCMILGVHIHRNVTITRVKGTGHWSMLL